MADSVALQAEQSVIGSILRSPECLPSVRKRIKLKHFRNMWTHDCYEAILKIDDSNHPIDAVIVMHKLVENGMPEDSADELIRGLMINTPTEKNVEAYCDIVLDDYKREALRDIAEKIELDSMRGDISSIVQESVNTLHEIEGTGSRIIKTSEDLAAAFSDYYNIVSTDPEKAYTKTGMKALDEKLSGGMFKSGLYIIGARPGMGKTTLSVGIAENIAAAGKPVLFLSLEMSDKQIMAKRLARQTGFDYKYIMTGRISEGNARKMFDAVAALIDRPFYTVDESGLNVSDIAALAQQIPNLQCVVVDYLGLIRTTHPEQNRPRNEEVTEISAALKAMAKSMNIPVLVLSQLNRESQKTKDKRPSLSELRDSGSIEQDADAVILLHRPNYYEGAQLERETIELDIAKNRHGDTGIVKMMWIGRNGIITDCEDKEVDGY